MSKNENLWVRSVLTVGRKFDGSCLSFKPPYEKPHQRRLFLVFDGLSNKTVFGLLARLRAKIEKMKFSKFSKNFKWSYLFSKARYAKVDEKTLFLIFQGLSKTTISTHRRRMSKNENFGVLGVVMSGRNFDGPYLFFKPTYEKLYRRHLFFVFDGLSNKTVFGLLARLRAKIEKMKFSKLSKIFKW